MSANNLRVFATVLFKLHVKTQVLEKTDPGLNRHSITVYHKEILTLGLGVSNVTAETLDNSPF